MSLLQRHILAMEELLARAEDAFGAEAEQELEDIRARLHQLRALAHVERSAGYFRAARRRGA